MRKLLMTTAIVAGLGFGVGTGAIAAPVPVEALAKPPADAKAYVIASTGGVHGQIFTWTLADGTLMERASMNLRGQKFELEQASTFGGDHMPSSMTVRGFTPNGDAAETFAVGHAKATWKSQVDAGEATYSTPKLYVAAGGAFVSNMAVLVEALIASPSHAIDLLPGGKATIEKLTELQIRAMRPPRQSSKPSLKAMLPSLSKLLVDSTIYTLTARPASLWFPRDHRRRSKWVFPYPPYPHSVM